MPIIALVLEIAPQGHTYLWYDGPKPWPSGLYLPWREDISFFDPLKSAMVLEESPVSNTLVPWVVAWNELIAQLREVPKLRMTVHPGA